MNKITILILTILSVYSHQNHEGSIHECAHDSMDFSKIVPRDYLETYDYNYNDRRLQNTTPQPIRITFDFSELDNAANGDGLTPSKKQFLKNIVEAAVVYLNKLIKVYPRTKPVKMFWGDICYDMKVPKSLQEVGVNNSDLHILVTYQNNNATTYLATAIWCQLDPNPVVGRIKFNIATMKIDENNTQSFQDNYSTSLHEILHILGFSGNGIEYWIDPDTGKPYGTQNSSKIMQKVVRWDNQNVIKLYSKNILRVARNHYGCPSIDGMYLENQGGPASMGSHWERDLLGNEFMTASIIRGVYSISEFTGALLLDTGYYAEINSNMLNNLFWGKNKGCDFFNKSCNSNQNFPEFPDKSIAESCDFHSRAISQNGSLDNYSQCNTMAPYKNAFCEDSETFKPKEKLRQNSGHGSKCFRSNAALKGEEDKPMRGRCFKVKCSSDGQSIQVNTWGDEYVWCKYPNQVINLSNETKTTQGVMKCPPNFDQFCNFPLTCPNNCSNNGVCNNGQCICRGGWAGEDCTIECPFNYIWNGYKCVQSCSKGQYKTFDNLCKSTCAKKQYGDIIKGTCELCHPNCSICSGPSSNQCSECNNGYSLSGNQCIEVKCHESCMSCSGFDSNQCTSCPYGNYLDSNKTCQPCKAPCVNCYNSLQCSTCQDGYILDEFSSLCNLNRKCDSSCLTCSNDPTKCASCSDGFMLSTQGQCLKCDSPCSKCSISQIQCTECIEGFIYDALNKQCVDKLNIKCHSSCKTCSDFPSGNKNFCTSCSDGQYLSGDLCLPCQLPCKTCQDASQQCLSCDETLYSYNSIKKSCDSKSCHDNCKTCTKPNDIQSCSSCYDDSFLQGQQCQACSSNCKTCSNNPTNCTSCQNGLDLQNGSCSKQVVCDPSCATCFKENDPLGCLTCSDNQWLQTNSDKSISKCLACDPACKTCKTTYECSSCAGETVLDQNSYCKPCQSGKKFLNGKCVDEISVKKSAINCDLTCSTCVGKYYDQCTQCAGNRILQITKSSINYGQCICPEGTTDINQAMCQVNSNLQSNVKDATSSAFYASATTTTVISTVTSNPIVALGAMEFSQSVSYLSYVNKKTAVGFDDTMNVVQKSHYSNIIDLSSYAEQDSINEKEIIKRRILHEGVEMEIEDEDEKRNPKFSQNHKTQLFVVNALALIIINAGIWAISGILSLFKSTQDKNSILFKLRRIYSISIPIIIFTLSSQEFSLLMFLQMLNLKTITNLQILSTVFSFLTLLYIIGLLTFLFYYLEYKRVLCESQNNYIWQQRFYLIYKYVKQDNFFTRNFVQITVIRKIVVSFITACISGNPITQVSLLILCYTINLVYLTISRPFKSNLYTVMAIIIDAIIVTIHVLYCILFAYEGDSDKEKVITLMMLILTFSVFFAYLVFTLIIIVKICYNLYKQWQAKRQNSKTSVKNPQIEKENPVQIEQQIEGIEQKSRNPSSNIIKSFNQLDENGNIASEILSIK